MIQSEKIIAADNIRGRCVLVAIIIFALESADRLTLFVSSEQVSQISNSNLEAACTKFAMTINKSILG